MGYDAQTSYNQAMTDAAEAERVDVRMGEIFGFLISERTREGLAKARPYRALQLHEQPRSQAESFF